MTFLSLFAGIGGMDLGLERAGMRCVGQVEIDPFCRRVLAKHWPDVPKWSDIRDFDGSELAEQPDLICGGFPCQDISNAGRGAGTSGSRSGLWREMVSCLRVVPLAVGIVENVAAILGRGLGVVLGDLASLGRDAEWDCIPAGAVGADHLRDRAFVVAYATGIGQSQPWIAWPKPVDLASGFDWETSGLVDAFRRGAMPYVCREAHGLAYRMERVTALGNAVVPQVAEVIGRAIVAAAKEAAR